MSQVDIIDFYRVFNIDREADTVGIKKTINERYKLWMKREGDSKPASEGFQHANSMLKLLDKAKEVLFNEKLRQEYNKQLDSAYQSGLINDETQAEALDAIRLAEKYFNEGKPELSAKYALEAIEKNAANSRAYEILAHSYYETGDYEEALNTTDKAIKLFEQQIDFEWLYTRFSINLEQFEKAQTVINSVLSRDKYNLLFNAEQAYLYCRAGRSELAFNEIRTFINAISNNELYKQYAASNLITYSHTLYLVDPENSTYVMTEKEAYDECLRVCEFANSIYSSNEVKQEFNDINVFGEKQFDTRNRGKLIFMALELVVALIAFISGFSSGEPSISLIAVALAIPIAIVEYALWKISFRPVWAILKEEYTGARPTYESMILGITEITCIPLTAIKAIFGE